MADMPGVAASRLSIAGGQHSDPGISASRTIPLLASQQPKPGSGPDARSDLIFIAHHRTRNSLMTSDPPQSSRLPKPPTQLEQDPRQVTKTRVRCSVTPAHSPLQCNDITLSGKVRNDYFQANRLYE